MKTRIYIDGFNLYYGCLKRTPYKWLDVVKLFESQILPQALPPHFPSPTVSVKYFTSEIKQQAAFDQTSLTDQGSYIRALEACYPTEKLEVIKGYFSIADEYAYVIDENEPGKHPMHCERVRVWKLEEKQTDVNIALHIYSDVVHDETLEQIVLVSNDTDLAPALAMVSKVRQLSIGLVVPIQDKRDRRTSKMLSDQCDWVMERVPIEALRASSLPRVITNNVRGNRLRKTIIKPDSWYGAPEILQRIHEELSKVLSRNSDRWNWLETRKPSVEGLPELKENPASMLDDHDSASKVLAHAEAYVRFKLGN